MRTKKRKLIGWKDIGSPDAERREYTVIGRHDAVGRTTLRIICPFCNGTLTAYLWSLSGCGKRCDCGALLGRLGSYRWKPEEVTT